MKKNNVGTRENDKFKGLMDGRHYLVVGSTQGQSVDLQDRDHGNVITVPKAALKNAFIFEGNDTPFPPTVKGEYVIENGQLFRNGERIETGTLRPVEIVDYVTNGVYLTVEAKEGESGKELRFYNPETDTFTVAVKGEDDYRVVFNDRQVIGVVARSARTEKLMPEKEDEEPEIVTAVNEKLLFFEGSLILYTVVTPDGGYLLQYDPSPMEETAEKAVDSSGREEAYARHLFFVLDRKVEAKTNMDGEVIFVEEAPGEVLDRVVERSIVMKVSIFYDGFLVTSPDTVFPEKCEPHIRVDGFRVDGEVKKVTPVFDNALNALVVTDQGITFSNFGHLRPRQAKGRDVLELVKKYPIGLSLWVNERGTEHIFTLCDDAYNMATVKVERTQDRGYVTTITENPGFGFQPAGNIK